MDTPGIRHQKLDGSNRTTNICRKINVGFIKVGRLHGDTQDQFTCFFKTTLQSQKGFNQSPIASAWNHIPFYFEKRVKNAMFPHVCSICLQGPLNLNSSPPTFGAKSTIRMERCWKPCQECRPKKGTLQDLKSGCFFLT